jgi:hypothetical protein
MLGDVVDPAHVRVRDTARRLDLLLEKLERLGVCDAGLDRLERHALIEHSVLGLVYFPHSAASNEADDPEALGHQLVRLKHRAGLAGHGKVHRPVGEEVCGMLVAGEQLQGVLIELRIAFTGFEEELLSLGVLPVEGLHEDRL